MDRRKIRRTGTGSVTDGQEHRDGDSDVQTGTGIGTRTGTGTGTGTGIATLQHYTSSHKHFQKVKIFPGFVLQHKVMKLHTSHHKCCQNFEEVNQQII